MTLFYFEGSGGRVIREGIIFERPAVLAAPALKHRNPMRVAGIIIGLVVAAAGGVIIYRALFLEPSAGVVITDESVREIPNTLRLTSGSILFLLGAALAFFAARRKPM